MTHNAFLDSLTEYDIQVLRELNGEKVEGLCWGAAMSVTCSYLKKLGFAQGTYEITEKGKNYLKELDSGS